MSRPRCGGQGGTPARPAGRGVGRWRSQRGSTTAELAAGLPVLVMLLLVGLAAVGAVTTKLQCVDAAREAALATARGEPGADVARRVAPEGAEISVRVNGETVVATVRARAPLLGSRLSGRWVEASAVAAMEPGPPGG